ncbi:MAG: WD40 repeat domain-containing protein, partial [Halobacteriaceae archaeon]
MLFAGSDDGVYRIEGLRTPSETHVTKVLDADQVFRLREFEGLEGIFATSESGLFYSVEGTEWTHLPLPEDQVYAITTTQSA